VAQMALESADGSEVDRGARIAMGRGRECRQP